MANRTVSVELQLKTAAYKAGIEESKIATESLDKKIEALDHDVNKIPGDATRAAAALDLMGAGAKRSADDAGQLDRRITELKASTKSLTEEFDKTGNSDLLKKFRSDSSELAGLTRMRKEFGGLAGDAEKGFGDLAKSGEKGLDDIWRDGESLVGKFGTIGKEVGQTLAQNASGAFSGSGFIGTLGSMLSNPVTGPALGGIALAIAPGVFSAVGGAIQAAAGGGFLAAGIAIAAKDPAVSAGLAGLKRDIGDVLTGAATPFRQEMLTAEKAVGDGFRQLAPGLKSAFSAVAPLLQPLEQGLMGLAKNALPGIEEAAAKSGPIFHELAADLPQLGKAVGDLFHDIAQGGQSGAAAFHLIFGAVEQNIEALGELLRVSALVFDAQMHPSHILKDVEALYGLQKVTQGIGGSLSAAGTAADGMSGSLDAAGGSVSAFGADATTAAGAMAAWNTQFDKTISDSLALNDQIAANTLNVDALKSAFKANGAVIDENQVKGAKNVQQIDQVIAGYQRQRDAAIAAGGGTAEAYAKANATYNDQLSKLQALLTTLLGSAKAAKNFMDQFYNKDVTVSVHIKTTQTGPVSQQGVVAGGVPLHGAWAEGGDPPPGLSLVGERGPELVSFAGTEHVYTASQSRSMMASSPPMSSGGPRNFSGPLYLMYSGPTTGLEGVALGWLAEASRKGQLQIHSKSVIS